MQQESQEGIEENSSQGSIIQSFLILICFANEIIDYAGLILNVTGIWEIIIFIIDSLTLTLIILWKVMEGGIKSFLNIKVLAIIILELIPIVGDLIPGWILLIFFGFKKKTKIAAKTKKAPSELSQKRERIKEVKKELLSDRGEETERRQGSTESYQPLLSDSETTEEEELKQRKQRKQISIKYANRFRRGKQKTEKGRVTVEDKMKKVVEGKTRNDNTGRVDGISKNR